MSLTLIVVLGLALGFYLLSPFFPDNVSETTATSVYFIEKDFDEVRPMIVRTNSTKELATLDNSELTHQEWLSLKFKLLSILRMRWNIKGTAKLVVKVDDPDLGEQILNLYQKVYINPDKIDSKVWLSEPCSHILDYKVRVKFERDEDRTKVTTTIYLKIKHTIPFKYHWKEYMDGKVKKAGERTLKRNEAGVRAIIKKYTGKKLLLPVGSLL